MSAIPHPPQGPGGGGLPTGSAGPVPPPGAASGTGQRPAMPPQNLHPAFHQNIKQQEEVSRYIHNHSLDRLLTSKLSVTLNQATLDNTVNSLELRLKIAIVLTNIFPDFLPTNIPAYLKVWSTPLCKLNHQIQKSG
jgi:hypothetical protein